MKTKRNFYESIDPVRYAYAMVCVMFLSMLFTTPTEARTFTVNVLDDAGAPLTGGFRWSIEEDNTHPVTPGAQVSDSLSLSIHKSYAPVVMSGEESMASSVSVDLPDGRYVISILPMSTTDSPRYTLGGSNFTIGPPPAPVSSNVVVYPEPIPTAQISIYVFHDYWPLNGEPDIPEEEGFAGFSVVIFDIFGQMMTDVYGNPLGTTYTQIGPDWVIDQMGTGIILTDANGEASIRNIAAGKYGVRVVPPTGTNWVQTRYHRRNSWNRCVGESEQSGSGSGGLGPRILPCVHRVYSGDRSPGGNTESRWDRRNGYRAVCKQPCSWSSSVPSGPGCSGRGSLGWTQSAV